MKPNQYQVKHLQTLKQLFTLWKTTQRASARIEFFTVLGLSSAFGLCGYCATEYLTRHPSASWKDLNRQLTLQYTMEALK